jgi:hypothetical protein
MLVSTVEDKVMSLGCVDVSIHSGGHSDGLVGSEC